MKRIYKYEIGCPAHEVVKELDLPVGCKIFHADVQYELMYLWALIDTNMNTVKRKFIILGTGQDIPDYDTKHYEHITTVQEHGYVANFVWHLFEVHDE